MSGRAPSGPTSEDGAPGAREPRSRQRTPSATEGGAPGARSPRSRKREPSGVEDGASDARSPRSRGESHQTRATGPAGGGGHPTVLVVEHDPGVAELIRLYLTREGYRVRLLTDPAAAAGVARRLRPDAIVLDLTTGVHRDVAAAAGPAVIVSVVPPGMTAPSGHTVPRPFSPRVLLAVVGRALRRHQIAAPGDDVLRAGNVILDPVTRAVTVAGASKALTTVEFELLAFLMGHPGRVFGREQLLVAVWGTVESAGARTVDVHIAQLRAKLGTGSPLRTVRGVGYVADA
ncbi:response regulator transcription factor [Actinoallomurus purpureus]|uniref:response regulator transcription factor n=1 Tax=Actinoallomurus purpureus TaxID=478114 RepID=UPI002093ED48|nr:response regulator transcription factor [Actinoallomurus purpureus]MCO6005907.1 response regulator transcription factor [Actinoallomurus purpureus]